VCITLAFQAFSDFDERQQMNRFLLRNILAYRDCQRVYLVDANPNDLNDFFDALIQGQFPLMKRIELIVSVLLLVLCTFAYRQGNKM
jgi:hypothetical protein